MGTELQNWEQHLQKEEQIYTTAYQTMNQVIAAYNLAYQMSRMPQNLAARYKSDFSQWTNLSIPACRLEHLRHHLGVAQCARTSAARPAPQSAYSSAVIQVQSYPSGNLSSLDSTTQATIQNQYASSEIGQANVTNLLSTLGTIRSDSQTFAAEARQSRIGHLFDRSQPADRGRLCSARSTPPRCFRSTRSRTPTRSSPPLSQQQALDAKEKLDERNRLINQAIYFQQNFPNVMQHDDEWHQRRLQSISLSPSGR